MENDKLYEHSSGILSENIGAKPLFTDALPQTEKEAFEFIMGSLVLKQKYASLHNEKWRRWFLDFLAGRKSLPLTYDPFFKYIFNPDTHRDRLESLISSIMGETVAIEETLSMENTLMDGESMLIMDLVVRFRSGALCNVEIQKQGFLFPAERMSSYSSDLMLRQYTGNRQRRSDAPGYADLNKVYMIVFFEESPKVFHDIPGWFIHHGKTMFDSGLPLELLQEYFLVSLDVFRKIAYSEREISSRSAWLSFLTTESLSDAEQLVADYPWLDEVYVEISELRRYPEEVLGMWSAALVKMDEDTLKYCVDMLREENDELKSKVGSQLEEINAQAEKIDAQAEEIEDLKRLLVEAQNKN